MSQPGWYADPTAPQGRRYWDGQRWADTGAPRRRPNGWITLAVALAAVAAIIIGILVVPRTIAPILAAPEDTRTSRPTGPQWNELDPSETPTPTPVETGFGKPIDCPVSLDTPRSDVVDGRLSGGGLSIARPQGKEWIESPTYIDWLHDSNSMIRSIAPGWISNVGVGYIKISDGFAASPSAAAEQFVTCMASSGMFLGFTKREILWNEEVMVTGRIGWRLTSNVYVGNQQANDIEGDTVDIVVVTTPDEDRLAVYVSCVTIDHAQNQREVQPVFESLRWDG